jgi:hypothetical protein
VQLPRAELRAARAEEEREAGTLSSSCTTEAPLPPELPPPLLPPPLLPPPPPLLLLGVALAEEPGLALALGATGAGLLLPLALWLPLELALL